ncbi:hypothetical protein AAC387_Pa12g1712 [Persea americana]
MPPKTRNGEGPSKGKGPSLQPILVQYLPPQPPRQRRSGGRSGALSVEEFEVTHSGSMSRGVTKPSRRDIPLLEQPRQSKEHTRQGEKSITKLGEKSARAISQSHHQANPDDDEGPLLEDVRAQNLVIQEQDELIRQLKQQLRERRRALSPPLRRSHASGPPPKQGQAPPSVEQDLRHVLNNKMHDRVHDEEDSSSNHIHEGPKKQRQKPEDEDNLKQ